MGTPRKYPVNQRMRSTVKQLNTSELQQRFEQIYAEAEKALPIGLLTTENCDVRADVTSGKPKLLKADEEVPAVYCDPAYLSAVPQKGPASIAQPLTIHDLAAISEIQRHGETVPHLRRQSREGIKEYTKIEHDLAAIREERRRHTEQSYAHVPLKLRMDQHHGWDRRVRWARHIRGLDMDVLTAMTCLPGPDDPPEWRERLMPAVVRILQLCHKGAESCSTLVLRLFRSADSNPDVISGPPMCLVREKTLCSKYAGLWKRLVCFLLRTHSLPNPKAAAHLYVLSEVKEAINLLAGRVTAADAGSRQIAAAVWHLIVQLVKQDISSHVFR
ncbi:hypothetical protein DV736_g6627, partial [Chaetothyriales sp. CBS 134916]